MSVHRKSKSYYRAKARKSEDASIYYKLINSRLIANNASLRSQVDNLISKVPPFRIIPGPRISSCTTTYKVVFSGYARDVAIFNDDTVDVVHFIESCRQCFKQAANEVIEMTIAGMEKVEL